MSMCDQWIIQYESPLLVRDNKRYQSLRTNNKDCKQGEGWIGNEDLRKKEVTTTAEGVPEGLPEATNSKIWRV